MIDSTAYLKDRCEDMRILGKCFIVASSSKQTKFWPLTNGKNCGLKQNLIHYFSSKAKKKSISTIETASRTFCFPNKHKIPTA